MPARPAPAHAPPRASRTAPSGLADRRPCQGITSRVVVVVTRASSRNAARCRPATASHAPTAPQRSGAAPASLSLRRQAPRRRSRFSTGAGATGSACACKGRSVHLGPDAGRRRSPRPTPASLSAVSASLASAGSSRAGLAAKVNTDARGARKPAFRAEPLSRGAARRAPQRRPFALAERAVSSLPG